MKKQEAYNSLVHQRKSCRSCQGLVNAAVHEGGKFDSFEIGPWTLWQSNLSAKIMIVGQDWGDKEYFTKWKGADQPSGNPTNSNLQKLLRQLDIDIKSPREPQEHQIFLTNLILCLKDGGLQAPIQDKWLTNCCEEFFRNLVELIRPRVVLALGKRVSETILNLYKIPHRKTWTLTQLMQSGPFNLFDTTYLFPVYHCGASGVNRNRSFEDQNTDWKKVANWIRRNDGQHSLRP
jgi:uracil-DNA glycosylase family 4